MRPSLLIAGSLVVVFALASPVAIGPAAAAGVGTFYAITESSGLVSRVDSTSGTLTPIPPAAGIPDISGVRVNNAGVGHAITFGATTEIFTVEIATGSFATLATVTDSALNPVSDCVGLGSDGADLVIACDTGTANPTVGRLDQSSWTYTPVVTWTDGFPPVTIATAANGATFAMSENGRLSRVDLTAGTITYIPAGTAVPPAVDPILVMAMAFDANQLYLIAVVLPTNALSLVIMDPTTAEAFSVAPLSDPTYVTSALAIVPNLAGAGAPVPAATLPETGAGVESAAWAAVMVLIGVALVTSRVVARRGAAQ